MGLIILGTAIAAAATSAKIQDLKRQIEQIVKRYQDLTKQVNRLNEMVKKLNLDSVSKKLDAMNKSLGQNLKTIIGDQQLKLRIMDKINPGKISVNPSTLLDKIAIVLTLVGTVIGLIQLMCATNPVTIVVSAILVVLDFVLSIFTLVNNIKTIQQLEQQHTELQERFKQGGEFHRQVTSMADLSFQMMENFYMVTVNFKSLMNQLAANINFISLSDPDNSTGLNYQYYLDLLQKNPFDQKFEVSCFETYLKFIQFQKQPLEKRVNLSCKVLEEFERKHDLQKMIELAAQIAGNFSSDSPIGKYLDEAVNHSKKLSGLKDKYQNGFKQRLNISASELKQYDKSLLQELLCKARYMPNKEFSVIQIVAFNTTEFFADDPTGKTLMGKNLQEVWQMTDLANFGMKPYGPNITYLPEPAGKDQNKRWHGNKNFLVSRYRFKLQHPLILFQFKRMFIRMEVGEFEVHNQKQPKSRLNFFYGILVRDPTSRHETYFEVPAVELYKSQYYSAEEEVKPKAAEKIQRMEETNESLSSLCSFVWFFINGIAYPERVTNLSITKVDNQYKAVLEWKEETQNREMMGKFLDFSVSELPIGDQKGVSVPEEKVFWKQSMPESSSKVVFKFR